MIDNAHKPPEFECDRDGTRRPSPWADPRHSGIEDRPLSWRAQHRLLLTIRMVPEFARELREALGVE